MPIPYTEEDLQVVRSIGEAIIASIGDSFNISDDVDLWALREGIGASGIAWHVRDSERAERLKNATTAYLEELTT